MDLLSLCDAASVQTTSGTPRVLTLATDAAVPVVAKLNTQLNDNPDADGDEANASNLGHNDLEVSHVVGATDQRRSPVQGGGG